MSPAASVLIVDDDSEAREFLRLLLEPRGYRVRTAACGREAREMLASWGPELVLMDMMLPDVNGLDLLREFREASPAAQVIMVTGNGSVPSAVGALKAGAFNFVEKPVDVRILTAALEKAAETFESSGANAIPADHLPQREHEAAPRPDSVGRADRRERPHPWRERHPQGTGGGSGAPPPVEIRDAGQDLQQPSFIVPPDCTLREIERLAILATLKRTHWNKRKAASILGVYRPTLYSKLKKYKIPHRGKP
jgi:DNA-binding NtrC family response regulator